MTGKKKTSTKKSKEKKKTPALRLAAEAETTAPKAPVEAVPETPFRIGARAKKFWPLLIKELEEYGELTHIDKIQAARLCEYYAEFVKLTKVIYKKGAHDELVSNKGEKYFAKRPEAGRQETIAPEILRIEKELGLTRKTRAGRKKLRRIDDDKARLFGGK